MGVEEVEPFRIEVHTVGERTVVAPHGEIDLATAPQLADALAAVEGPVTLDLDGVLFIDSTGLRVILQAHEAARSSGRGFTLSGGTPATRRLLELTGVAEVLSDDGGG